MAAEHRGTFYGRSDVPLSEQGLAATRELAAELAAQAPQRILSSTLQRAWTLAADVSRRVGVPLRLDADLRELDRGGWTGRRREEIGAEAIAAYAADPETGNAPDGERESEIAARVWGALRRAVDEAPGAATLLVAHAHVLRVVMARLSGWSPAESMAHFVPCLGIVDVRLDAHGNGEVLAAPPGMSQATLLSAR